jgi:hypothetical protein
LTLEQIVSVQLSKFNSTGAEWMDSVMNVLMFHWPQQDMPTSMPLHPALIQYINGRRSNDAVQYSIGRIGNDDQLWDGFARSLADPTLQPPQQEILTAMWRLASFSPQLSTSVLHHVLESAASLDVPAIPASIVVLLKSLYLRNLGNEMSETTLWKRFADPVLPKITAVTLSSDLSTAGGDRDDISPFWELGLLKTRIAEAEIVLIAEFLEFCAGPDPIPYEPAATLRGVSQDHGQHLASVHNTHQARLAEAIKHSFQSPRCSELRSVIISTRMFDAYTKPFPHSVQPWLDHRNARESIKSTFTGYADALAASSADRDSVADHDLLRVRAIIHGLDSLHTTHTEPEGTLDSHMRVKLTNICFRKPDYW